MYKNRLILDLVDEYLGNQDIRDNSRKKYADALRYFITHLVKNGVDPGDIKRKDIIEYKKHLIATNKALMTVDNYLVPIRQFFKYLEEGGIHDNIAAGIHSPRKYLGYRKDYLKPEQVHKLLSSIDRSTLVGKRDYAIINLMVRTGMRCIEVERANAKDLKIENGKWFIYIQRKGHYAKDSVLGITEKVMAPIADYFKERDLIEQPSPLFLNHAHSSNNTRITTLTISKIIKRHLREIGIDSPKITAHSLRHTAAITALNNSASLFEVQQMLGHRSSDTTQIYLRAIEEEKSREGTAVRLLDDAFDISNKKGQKQ